MNTNNGLNLLNNLVNAVNIAQSAPLTSTSSSNNGRNVTIQNTHAMDLTGNGHSNHNTIDSNNQTTSNNHSVKRKRQPEAQKTTSLKVNKVSDDHINHPLPTIQNNSNSSSITHAILVLPPLISIPSNVNPLLIPNIQVASYANSIMNTNLLPHPRNSATANQISNNNPLIQPQMPNIISGSQTQSFVGGTFNFVGEFTNEVNGVATTFKIEGNLAKFVETYKNQKLSGTARFYLEGHDSHHCQMKFVNGAVTECSGKRTHKHGIYTGQMSLTPDNLGLAICGKGKFNWTDGLVEDGDWENGKLKNGEVEYNGERPPKRQILIGKVTNNKFTGESKVLFPSGAIFTGKKLENGTFKGKIEAVLGEIGYIQEGEFENKGKEGRFQFTLISGTAKHNGQRPAKGYLIAGTKEKKLWVGAVEILFPTSSFQGRNSPNDIYHGKRISLDDSVEDGEFHWMNETLKFMNGKKTYEGEMPPPKKITLGRVVNGEFEAGSKTYHPDGAIFTLKSKLTPKTNDGIIESYKGIRGYILEGEFVVDTSNLNNGTYKYKGKKHPDEIILIGEIKNTEWIKAQALLPNGDVISLEQFELFHDAFIGKKENPSDGIEYNGEVIHDKMEGQWVKLMFNSNRIDTYYDGIFKNGIFQKGWMVTPQGTYWCEKVKPVETNDMQDISS